MATKYSISNPHPALPATVGEGIHKYTMFGRSFTLPNGLDCEGRPILADIPATANWHACHPPLADISWFICIPGQTWFVSEEGVVLYHHKSVNFPRDGGFPEKKHYHARVSDKMWFGKDYIVTDQGVIVLPSQLTVGYWIGYNSQDSICSHWDDDLIITTRLGVYNVDKKEIVYYHVDSATTYVKYFMDGWVGICGNDNAPKYRLKITKKTRKPTINDCPICLLAKPKRVAFNCGHALCCVECSSGLKACPMCRAAITFVIPLFQ